MIVEIVIGAGSALATGAGTWAVMQDRIRRLMADVEKKASKETVVALEERLKTLADGVVYEDTCKRCQADWANRDGKVEKALSDLGERIERGFEAVNGRIDTLMLNQKGA
jgi:exonuclease VII small subunit